MKNKNSFYCDPIPIMHINNVNVTACTVNNIVEHVVFSQEYKNLVKTICKSHLWEELHSEITLYIMEKWELKKMQELLLRGEFKFFFVKAVKFQWEGKQSSFYIKYRRPYYNQVQFDSDKYNDEENEEELLEQEIKDENTLKLIENEIEKLDWYDRKIWEMHQTMSIQDVSRLTGIKTNSLYKTITGIKILIRNRINKKIDYL